MKKRITFLMAAFTLLAFLAIPMGVWGQSDYSSDYTGNITLSTEGGANASTCVISISNTNYNGIKAGTSSKAGAVMISVPSGTKYLHIHAAAWNQKPCSLAITPAGYSSDIALTANSGIANNSPFTFNGDPSTSDYYKVITFTNALTADTELTFTATGNTRFVIWGVTSEEAGATPTVSKPTITPNGGSFVDSQEISISCTTDGATIYYTTNGNDPTTSSTQYTAPFTLTATTTVKAFAVKSGMENSAIATAEFTKASAMTVADAIAALNENSTITDAFVSGIVSQVDEVSTQHGNATYWISDDGTTTSQLEVYRGKYLNNANFTSADQIQVGDEVVVYGTLTYYNNTTYEFTTGNYLISLNRPTPSVATPTFNPAAGTYAEAQTVTISCANPDAAIYYTLDGTEPTNASTPYTTAINVATTTTIKAIAYVGTNASAVTTATYNIVSLANISAITEVGTAYEVQGTVVATNSRGFVMGDGTGYVYYYKNGAVSQSIGDMVKITGTTGTYGQIIQFTNTATVTEATTSNYNETPAAIVITEVPDYTQGYHLSTYLEFEGALTKSGSNYFITLGDAQIQISYPTTEQGNALTALAGKDVRVKGYFAGINSSDKFTVMLESVAEVASTNPAITIASNTIDAPVEGTSGTLTVTYQNITELYPAVDYCDAEGNATSYDWFTAEIDDDNNVAYTVVANQGEARVAHFRVYATDDEGEDVFSDIVTINQEAYVAPALDYATLPFAFNGGKADIEGTNGLYQEGLGNDYNSAPKLKFDGAGDWLLLQFDERPGTLTFDIKGNGSGSDPWAGVFKVMVSTNGVNFVDKVVYETGDLTSTKTTMTINDLASDVRFIKWVYDTKTLGNVALGNIALDEYVAPQEYTLTVEPFENLELITFVNDEMVMEGDGEIQVTNGNQIMLSIVANEGYVMETLMVNGVNHVNDIAEDYTYTFEMPAENVTISATAVEDVPPTPGTWVLTDLADLTENDVFVIVGDNGDTYAMPNDNGTSNPPAAVAVTVAEGTLSAEPAANLQWNISITDDGYTFYPNGETESWLYCTNTNNGVRVGTNTNNVFVLDNESGYLKNVATSRYIGIYNSQDWRCYTNTTGNIADQTFAFYKKVETLPANSIVIEGYGESEGGYYLIASPFTVSPEDVQGMTEGEYDLYSFDEAEENEWRNYKAGAFTNLEPGKGYLYAHSTTVTLTFDGEAYNDEPIVLKKTAGGDFPGWNLVGNPYTETAYIDRDFYVMNPETGGEIITGEGNEIAPMQGFFVIADQDGEELEISTEPTEEGSKIVMNVNSNRGNIIDRAVVRFGEGRQLPKFMLNEDNTKLYIAKGEEEYAVARNEAKGEMNLNFEAAEDGTYTLDFAVVNVELDQFLLIDNKTGVSIDLLSSSSYTFEANTTDNASRFRVVFGITTTVSEENANTFAFYNNGNLILNNEGSAILNVVDVLGRIISSYNINGSESIHINAQAGVYMLQLVQGDKIQTQKIVVE